ncbi:MAG: ferredoxin:protochlorophyllide reductase (ATP-dependent) subunit B [Rhizobiaceae bacterium]|nr:ferredoxin:protochlorophyllide reductase (ATP-dependent) subunit B [Hyphomicrobiales bacterium]NRB30362.1 ferredoxin:protochlorophyllide reductase (ATP-dependent) subunit B [Rhizobiaceae bacterium]
MQLTLWTYEGPPHVGAMRIATAMTDLHYVLHAPQGDTYADLLFTMIERRKKRPPVTYTTFQARDLGADTSQLFMDAARDAQERFNPAAMIVGASCTGELIQDDPGGLSKTLGLPVPVIPLELPSYSKKENWGASETFYQIVRHLAPLGPEASERTDISCNILGPTALGFRHRDDVTEIKRLLESLGISVNVVAPLDASVHDLLRLRHAEFNVVLYPEIAATAAAWLKRTFRQPFTTIVPIGVGATRDFIREIAEITGRDADTLLEQSESRLPWYSRSIDSTYLTNKRVFLFGDATHVIALARVAEKEMGFKVVGMGTYTRERARDVRDAAESYGVEALITDDYLEVERLVQELQPEMVLGTQMERHMAKRLGIPCAVISAPVHVQDYPARYSPLMGFEGANVLFDTLVHPLTMGLEEHLLQMFRDDFEFNDAAGPSHLSHGGHGPVKGQVDGGEAEPEQAQSFENNSNSIVWLDEAERELKKVPFFVRGKARRNTEKFAAELGLAEISMETLYEAKSHFSR